MEIGTIIQGSGQVGVNAQQGNTSQVGEKIEVTDSSQVVQKAFQIDIKDGLKNKLADFVNLLQNREQLVGSLPEDIQKAVVELLEPMSPDAELPQGVAPLLNGQKNMAEQLKNMGTILDFAALLSEDEHSEVKAVLPSFLENFTSQAETTPQQSAIELLQLVKQLPASTTVSQGNVKQAVEQLLQQVSPENMQSLSTNEQKSVTQLTNLLGKDMPVQVQQLAQQTNLTELPGVWVALKAAEAWQFKDIQPKTLQAAADLLTQLVQEMSPEKSSMAGELEQFIKNLPTEVGNKDTAPAQLGQVVKDLLPVGGTKAAVLVPLEQFANSLPPEIGNKSTVVAQLEQFTKNLPPEVSNKSTALAQLEQFIKTLPPEIGKALEQALKQENISDSLGTLAERFSNAALLNEHMNSDLQSFIEQKVENFAAKSPSMPADTNQILTQLTQQLSHTNVTIEQLKNLIQQLKTQLFAGDPKLLEKQQHALDQLTQLFEQNIPQALQEGAVKHKLPELPKLWVLLNSLGAEQWQHLELQNLQKSAGVVKELAQSMYKSTGLSGEKQAEQSTLSFSVPLHVAEGVYYPAHIHIYHQQKNNSSQPTEREFETWLRVCVDTEHIGMVESVFRLYGDNKLSVRVTFPDTVAVDQFSQDLHNVRTSISDGKLNLTDITVNKV